MTFYPVAQDEDVWLALPPEKVHARLLATIRGQDGLLTQEDATPDTTGVTVDEVLYYTYLYTRSYILI